MIIDTSAIIAILVNEPEGDHFIELLMRADAPVMSAGSRVELTTVIVRKRLTTVDRQILALFRACGIGIEPLTAAQADLAGDAYRRYGRGSGHPARLNLGDCFAYALARERDEPLLFKGDDFRRTDIRAAA